MSNESQDNAHDVHDGIIELDNPAPLWWQRLFYITIVWGVLYMGWYLLGEGESQKQTVAKQLMEIELKKRSQSQGPDNSAEELRAFFKDPSALKEGRVVYEKNCVACHGAHGEGGIGPNLADKFWIHGDGSIDQILVVIKDGVAAQGMPPWGGILKHDQLIQVTAFVRSLRGTSPSGPKAPQGGEIDLKEEI